jgi:hypothetical protein
MAPAWTTPQRQSKGAFLFQHADSGNWKKLKIPGLIQLDFFALAATLTHLWGVKLVSHAGTPPFADVARPRTGTVVSSVKRDGTVQ